MAITHQDEARHAIQVTNHETGEVWAIHDTREVCLTERDKRLKTWGKANCTVEGPVPINEENPDE